MSEIKLLKKNPCPDCSFCQYCSKTKCSMCLQKNPKKEKKTGRVKNDKPLFRSF